MVFQNLRDLRDKMITTLFLSALRKLTSNFKTHANVGDKFFNIFVDIVICIPTRRIRIVGAKKKMWAGVWRQKIPHIIFLKYRRGQKKEKRGRNCGPKKKSLRY